MAKSGDSPQATRRRVWRFVFVCLGVVLVVAFWPLKGYRIDKAQFIPALGSPYIAWDPGRNRALGGKPAALTAYVFETVRGRREYIDGFINFNRQIPDYEEISGFDSLAWCDGTSDSFIVLLPCSNAACIVYVSGSPEVPGKTREEIAHECVDAVRDGIEREISGVTTFYNPPARQLYYDRVRPFLAKHFPKAFAP